MMLRMSCTPCKILFPSIWEKPCDVSSAALVGAGGTGAEGVTFVSSFRCFCRLASRTFRAFSALSPVLAGLVDFRRSTPGESFGEEMSVTSFGEELSVTSPAGPRDSLEEARMILGHDFQRTLRGKYEAPVRASPVPI